MKLFILLMTVTILFSNFSYANESTLLFKAGLSIQACDLTDVCQLEDPELTDEVINLKFAPASENESAHFFGDFTKNIILADGTSISIGLNYINYVESIGKIFVLNVGAKDSNKNVLCSAATMRSLEVTDNQFPEMELFSLCSINGQFYTFLAVVQAR